MNSLRLTLLTFFVLTFVCLVVGGVGGSILLREIGDSNRRLQVANNREYGQRFAASIETQLRKGTSEENVLSMLQDSFESRPFDKSRYLCVLANDGTLLCHPALRDGVLRHADPNEEIVQEIPITGAPWRVLVHTNLSVLREESVVLQRTILLAAIPMGILIVLMGTAMVRFASRQQEKTLEDSHRLLEARVEERTRELRSAIAELQRTRNALLLNEKMALLGQLIAGIAHEINNPLFAIQLFAEGLKDDADSGEQREAAIRISRSAQRCSILVRNLLSFARNEPPVRIPAPLNELVETALAFCASEIYDANIELECRLTPESLPIPVDRVQIEQVVLNLVTNAIHALSTVSGPRRLLVETVQIDDAYKLTVQDNGPGLPPEIENHLFEPFHTTKGEEEGTGLGLSLCRRFIEHHGGSIRYRRADHGGACFIVELPMRTSTEAAILPESAVSAIR